MLLAMAFIMPLTFSVWNALLNNFAVEQVAFTGREIGILQSLREVPGFLTFTVVFTCCCSCASSAWRCCPCC